MRRKHGAVPRNRWRKRLANLLAPGQANDQTRPATSGKAKVNEQTISSRFVGLAVRPRGDDTTGKSLVGTDSGVESYSPDQSTHTKPAEQHLPIQSRQVDSAWPREATGKATGEASRETPAEQPLHPHSPSRPGSPAANGHGLHAFLDRIESGSTVKSSQLSRQPGRVFQRSNNAWKHKHKANPPRAAARSAAPKIRQWLIPGFSPKSRHPLLRKRLWIGALVVFALVFKLQDSSLPDANQVQLLDPVLVEANFAPRPQDVADHPERVRITVHESSTFGELLGKHPFSPSQTHSLFEHEEAVTWLAHRLRPGRVIAVDHHNWLIERIEYPIDQTRTLVALWDEAAEAFNVRIDKAPVLSQPAFVEGRIDKSFYVDALAQGMRESLVLSVAAIYQWDVDFVLDIRKGDGYKVLYSQEYLGEVELPPNKVLAAQFMVQGETITAIAYEFPQAVRDSHPEFADAGIGFYTPNGAPMRKAFLRMPLEFGRVSSRFNPNRIHPLFGTRRPHRGTDYAAPRHTPILAVANGRVTRANWGTGYGRVVEIDHGNGFSTLYAHMQTYRHGIRRGVRVSQGQVIGTVGSSGWATGPHVHFEFKVNGVHKDPERVKLPNAPPLPQELLPAFLKHKDRVMAMFNRFSNRSSLRAGG